MSDTNRAVQSVTKDDLQLSVAILFYSFSHYINTLRMEQAPMDKTVTAGPGMYAVVIDEAGAG